MPSPTTEELERRKGTEAAQMLVEGRPDEVMAFVHNLATSKGTQDMIKRAREVGIPVHLFPPRHEATE